MKNTPSYSPYTHHIRKASVKAPQARDAADFLRSHNTLSALMPTAARLVTLQQECFAILPGMFHACEILHLHEGLLTLRTPNAALAAKLKQHLPKLQAQLAGRGWQVNDVRLKIQVRSAPAPITPRPPPILPSGAVSAFAELERSLENSPRNQALRTALESIIRRNTGGR
jgi:hypothetical protein